ncbi:hypothetical protein ETAA8_06970 [Anatilimnocola aggregata]|uniref:Uncharacterized protein n=1 Tax=Anatilimnocola aggregata TaxID=2528021 RepID=A0A517Y5V7_9BACT|nr:hypothetical protein ETAA8_06970 [Anatilimnocola aggregata]
MVQTKTADSSPAWIRPKALLRQTDLSLVRNVPREGAEKMHQHSASTWVPWERVELWALEMLVVARAPMVLGRTNQVHSDLHPDCRDLVTTYPAMTGHWQESD